VVDTSVPHALLALARIGYGVAVVPSNQLRPQGRAHRAGPFTPDGRSASGSR
jgi:hypothetical protein